MEMLLLLQHVTNLLQAAQVSSAGEQVHAEQLCATVIFRLCSPHSNLQDATLRGGVLPPSASPAPSLCASSDDLICCAAHAQSPIQPRIARCMRAPLCPPHRLKWYSHKSGTWSDEKRGEGNAVLSWTCLSSTISSRPPTDSRSYVYHM